MKIFIFGQLEHFWGHCENGRFASFLAVFGPFLAVFEHVFAFWTLKRGPSVPEWTPRVHKPSWVYVMGV